VSVWMETRRCRRVVTDGKLAGLQELVTMAGREVTPGNTGRILL